MASMDGCDRNRLSRLADLLPDEAIPAATRYLEYLAERGDPFFRHLMETPEEERELSDTGQRLLDEGYEDIDAGRLHGLDEVKRELNL